MAYNALYRIIRILIASICAYSSHTETTTFNGMVKLDTECHCIKSYWLRQTSLLFFLPSLNKSKRIEFTGDILWLFYLLYLSNVAHRRIVCSLKRDSMRFIPRFKRNNQNRFLCPKIERTIISSSVTSFSSTTKSNQINGTVQENDQRNRTTTTAVCCVSWNSIQMIQTKMPRRKYGRINFEPFKRQMKSNFSWSKLWMVSSDCFYPTNIR